MSQHSSVAARLSAVSRWTTTALAGACLLLWVVALVGAVYVATSAGELAGIGSGSLMLAWDDGVATSDYWHEATLRVEKNQWVLFWIWYQSTPGVFSTFHDLAIPLWMPTVLFGGTAALLWIRRPRPGSADCPACGYDRTGLSGPCPECGHDAIARAVKTGGTD